LVAVLLLLLPLLLLLLLWPMLLLMLFLLSCYCCWSARVSLWLELLNVTVCRGERLSTIWLALAANKYCSSRAQVPCVDAGRGSDVGRGSDRGTNNNRLVLTNGPVV